MTKMPQRYSDTAAAIFKSYEDKAAADTPRPHLGASLIGDDCERKLWYSFRWHDSESFEGRMLRLFARGDLEEIRFVEDLRAIGVEVHELDEGGNQWRVKAHGGHFGGSMDGCAKGILEAPDTWHVLEFKTHNAKSFEDLRKNGVRNSKPQHFAQMQVYMGLTGMTRAFYMAANKNDDNIYTERVQYCESSFKGLMDKAQRIIASPRPLEKLSQHAEFYKCKWCAFQGVCHLGKEPARNCRSCRHAAPSMVGDGQWDCELHQKEITYNDQVKGCEKWEKVQV